MVQQARSTIDSRQVYMWTFSQLKEDLFTCFGLEPLGKRRLLLTDIQYVDFDIIYKEGGEEERTRNA
jgi:hypothetical protein